MSADESAFEPSSAGAVPCDPALFAPIPARGPAATRMTRPASLVTSTGGFTPSRLAGAALGAAAVAAWLWVAPPTADARDVTERTLAGLVWRPVGPAHMSGRITDIAVHPDAPHIVYCGAATGGVWKTTNNGVTWAPVFDDAGSASIGALAISRSNPDIVWVGTGESNASSYTSWGDGVYKSTDGGRTWVHMGLRDSHHVGRVLIHPTDPDVVYVAALGPLWGAGSGRGLFRTRDGGRTWTRVLRVNEDAGVVDVVMDPLDPRVLYAASWARRADRFDDFDSIGVRVRSGGGIHKSTDGGETWTSLTVGLPEEGIGRIGLAVAASAPWVVYAIVEVAPRWIALPDQDVARLRRWLSASAPLDAADAGRLRAQIERLASGHPDRVVVAGLSRSEQAQARVLLGMGPLDAGGGIFRSDDAGATWRRTNPLNEREPYYSKLRVDPTNPDRVYVLLVRVWVSEDGGVTFEQTDWAMSSWLTSDYIHGDFHAMWINPRRPDHLIVGTDGGLYSSYDRGAAWEAHPMPIGQFVRIAVDMRHPYFIYGGLQDNGTWGGPSATRHRSGITGRDWFKVISGDGAYTQVDPADHTRVYTESQYANIVRVDLKTGERRSIRPRHRDGEPALRFNFVSPFLISPHDSRTLYLGAQRVLKSSDRGESWLAISEDLTRGRPDPDTGEGATITTLTESPVRTGVLWAGTDDGEVQVSRDGGRTWTSVVERIPGLPRDAGGKPALWVSRIEASPHDAGTAYVAFDNHRLNDFSAYLFETTDYGHSWRSIVSDLPANVPVNVVRADRVNPDLLFVGTETGVHVSIDRGRRWTRLMRGLPTVPVDDLVIHPRESELIAGTHGRSIYVLDIAPLQQMTGEVLTRDLHLFQPGRATLFAIDPTRNTGASGARRFAAPNPYTHLVEPGDSTGMAPSGATFFYHLGPAALGRVTITIEDVTGRRVRRLEAPAGVGLQRLDWDLRGEPLPGLPPWRRVGGNDSRRLADRDAEGRPGPLVEPGTYRVRIQAGGRTKETTLRVEPDPGPDVIVPASPSPATASAARP